MKIKNLLDVCDINDKTVDDFQGIKNYVATGDVDYDKIISFDEVSYDDKPSRANREVEVGDILVAKMKETVKVVKITEENYFKYIFSTGFSTLKAKEDKLNSDYLYCMLISDNFQNQKDKYSKGATQKAINNTGLKKIKIPVPPINIQKQIVEILDQAQALIDNRKEQIKLLDDLIESIFYDMFGDPVRNDKGWEVDVLKNKIYDIDSGWSPRCYTNQAGIDKWGVLKLSAVTGGIYNSFENKELPEELNPKQENEVKTGDLLITRKNTPELVGDSCYVFETRNRLMLPDTIFRINTKKEINKLFLPYIFNNRTFKYKIKNLASGSAKSMSNISKQKLNNLKVPIPPIELQNEFSEKVEQIESKKQLLEDSLFLLENNYNSLMQKAFKGQLF